MVHELKIVNPYFRKVALGIKTFELRKNDRDFKQFDWLVLKEYDSISNKYSGNYVKAMVIYMLKNYKGIEKGYCILGLKITDVYVND